MAGGFPAGPIHRGPRGLTRRTKMSQEDFERFRYQVLEDLALQNQLRGIEDREAFLRRVVELGQENGYAFDVKDVTFAMQASRRAWIERGLG